MSDVTRRLAAIVAIDVAGYSRLMGADEAGTLTRLKEHRAATDPIGAEHGGRIVGTAGDGLLLEFPSVIEAVNFARKTQAVMAERNADLPDDHKMLYRIGINLGDVMVDGDDIYGDGVNVAARIEALAEPGGICISRAARDQVRDRMEIDLEDQGEVEVKNIVRPVRVFRVLAEGEVARAPVKQRPVGQWIVAAAVLLLVVVVGGGVWWWQEQPDFEPADPAKMAYALPENPSIAVLPCDNLTGDKNQEFIGDGLAENIIAVLATSPDLVVIARNSSFTFKGKATKVQEVAEQLGVRYVLECSVQQSGDQLRVTAQLIDAIDGKHLWAERYDRPLKDLFALQDDITQKILLAMQVELTLGEQAKAWRALSPDSESWRAQIIGRAHFQKWSPEGHKEAERLWTEIYERDRDGVAGNQLMGWLYWQKVVMQISKDPQKDLATARSFAEKALSAGVDAHTHLILAWLDIFELKHDSATAHADRAVELLPSGGDTNSIGGTAKIYSGQPAEGVELLKKGMRYEPDYPEWAPRDLSLGLMMLGRYDEAKKVSEGALASEVEDVWTHLVSLSRLAVISIFEGDQESAEAYVVRAVEIFPKANLEALKRSLYFWKDQTFADRYLEALRKAGYPEKPRKPLPDKPSIAVLPFENMSDDPKQTYFAHGMAEDIITDLSKISGLFVIARH